MEAMHQYHFSPFRKNSGRFPTVSFLSGVFVTLTSVILAKRADRPVLSKAGEGFLKAVQLLEDISPGFTLARRMLARLQKVIKATTQTMAEIVNNTSSSSELLSKEIVPMLPIEATSVPGPVQSQTPGQDAGTAPTSVPAAVAVAAQPPFFPAGFDFDLDDLLHFERSPFPDDTGMNMPSFL